MELAKALVKLWERKVWVAIGIAVAALAAFGSLKMLKSKVYAAATTQMVVDSPQSALGNTAPDLTPFAARAGIFARLMTSPEALNAIGQAAGIPAQEIAAQGPPEVAVPQAGQQSSGSATHTGAQFKLLLNQDPNLPTIDVYTEAPSTRQAVALANGAVTGFASYLRSLGQQGSVPPNRRVDIRQLGSAVGGVVDPGANTKLAGLIGIAVLVIWCAMILYISRLRSAWPSRATAPAGASDTAANGDHPAQRSSIRPAPDLWTYAEDADGNADDDLDSEPAPDRTPAVAESPFVRHER
jgi:hypothetical protein